jgi:hypothetical protein
VEVRGVVLEKDELVDVLRASAGESSIEVATVNEFFSSVPMQNAAFPTFPWLEIIVPAGVVSAVWVSTRPQQ